MTVQGAFSAVLFAGVDFIRFCRGFDSKSVQVDGFEWSYIEREGRAKDTTEPVIFLHGFSSVKESWVRVAAGVDKSHSIVIPDLPGHGRSSPADPTASYTMLDQAQRLHGFLDSTVPADRKVHLVGCSMGGLLAGLYSALHPERVRSVTMICPAGLTMPTKSEAYRRLEETGRNPLLAHTTDGVLEMVELIQHQRSRVPRMFASLMAAERKKQLPLLERLAADLLAQPTVLEDHLHHIQARTMVMWGKNDRILDISSLPILQEKLVKAPTKHILTVDNCGHILQHEKYEDCIHAINTFLADKIPTGKAM